MNESPRLVPGGSFFVQQSAKSGARPRCSLFGYARAPARRARGRRTRGRAVVRDSSGGRRAAAWRESPRAAAGPSSAGAVTIGGIIGLSRRSGPRRWAFVPPLAERIAKDLPSTGPKRPPILPLVADGGRSRRRLHAAG